MRETNEMLGALQRMSCLVALVAVKGLETRDAVLLLKRAGYGQSEIATLLKMKLNAVSMILLRHRRGNSGNKAKKAATNAGGD